METSKANNTDLAPVRKSVTVQRSVSEAFEIFAGRLGDWWPKHQYSISQERTASCAIEPEVGGRVYETRDDGQTFVWGKVLAWDPPYRLLLSWHPGVEPEAAQEVEVRFIDDAGSTRVELEHRNWAGLGEQAAQRRENYAGGWSRVLGEFFTDACAQLS